MDKANGKGKFLHIDGDLFEGEWIDDRVKYLYVKVSF